MVLTDCDCYRVLRLLMRAIKLLVVWGVWVGMRREERREVLFGWLSIRSE